MKPEEKGRISKPWYKKKIVWIPSAILIILSCIIIIIYANFNRIVSEALHKSFDSNVISDVYELKFDKLRVNLIMGDISVSNLVMQPREKPLRDYPHINSSFRLTTNKLLLKNVKIDELLANDVLALDKIEIVKPEISFYLAGKIHVFFPFKDTTDVSGDGKSKAKKSIEAFFLQQFKMINAHFQVTNEFKQREFSIAGIDFSFDDLYLSQRVGTDSVTCKSISLSVDSLSGTLFKSSVKHVKLRDFSFNLENTEVQKTIDTVIFNFRNFTTEVHDVDIITADSIYQIALNTFNINYKGKSILLTGMEFKPIVSDRELQKRFQYQNTQAAVSVGKLEIKDINFNSLIYKRMLLIDEITVDSVALALFKDKTKPVDPERFPKYLGQNIAAVKMPLNIKKVTAKNVTIVNRERKPDGEVAMVLVNRLQGEVKNITNMSTDNRLIMSAEAYLEDKAHFKASLAFDYIDPTFSIDATIYKFELKDLNRLLLSYTPAKLNAGTIDEITLTGNAFRTNATGTMKFLYHDLDINLQLEEKAKWKSSLGAFAANSVLNSSNPASPEEPPRIVKYEAERDMQKGFINIVLKSLFAGLKETMIMSKENRKAFHEKKKDWKGKNKDK